MPKYGPALENNCKRQLVPLPPKEKAPAPVRLEAKASYFPKPTGGYVPPDQSGAGTRSLKDFLARIPGDGSDPVEEAPRFTRTVAVAFPADRLASFKDSKARVGDFRSSPGCEIALPKDWTREGSPSAGGGRWPSIPREVQRHILFEGHLHPHQYPAGELTQAELTSIEAQETAIWQSHAEQLQKAYESHPNKPGDFPDKVKPAEYPLRDFVPKGFFPRDVSAVQVLDEAQARLGQPSAFQAVDKKSSSQASYIVPGQHHGALDVESDAPLKAGPIDIQVRVVAARTAGKASAGAALRVKTCYPCDQMPKVLEKVLPALGSFLNAKARQTLQDALRKGQWGWAYNTVRDLVVERQASGDLSLTLTQRASLEYAGCLLRVVWPERYVPPVAAADGAGD